MKSFFKTLVFLVLFVGCTEPSGHDPEIELAKFSNSISSIIKEHNASLDSNVYEKEGRIYGDIWNIVFHLIQDGQQDVVAQYILNQKKQSKEERVRKGWVEEAFSSIWMNHDVPLQIGASEMTIKALTFILKNYQTRNAGVAAAITLRKKYPDLGRSILLKEYGNFVCKYIPPNLFLERHSHYYPINASKYFSFFNLKLPPEYTTPSEAAWFLFFPLNEFSESNLENIAGAVNLYHRKVREIHKKNNFEYLQSLQMPMVRQEYLWACLEEYKKVVVIPEKSSRE